MNDDYEALRRLLRDRAFLDADHHGSPYDRRSSPIPWIFYGGEVNLSPVGSSLMASVLSQDSLKVWAKSASNQARRNSSYSADSAGSGLLQKVLLRTRCPASIPDISAFRTPCDEEGSDTLAASPATKYPAPEQPWRSRHVTSEPLTEPTGFKPSNSAGEPSRRSETGMVNSRVQW